MIPWPQSQLAYSHRKQPMSWPPCTEKLAVAESRTRLNYEKEEEEEDYTILGIEDNLNK